MSQPQLQSLPQPPETFIGFLGSGSGPKTPFEPRNADVKKVVDWILAVSKQRFKERLEGAGVLQFLNPGPIEDALRPLDVMVMEFVNVRAEYLGPIIERGGHELHLYRNPILDPLLEQLFDLQGFIFLSVLQEGKRRATGLPENDQTKFENQAWESAMANWQGRSQSRATTM